MLKEVINRIIFKKVSRTEETNYYSPNILLTSYCNQNCSFCFASQLMGERSSIKHINFVKYLKLLDYLETNNIREVFLMGGEPTMHPDFFRIIKKTIEREFDIEIFTNGYFSDKTREFLVDLGNKIRRYHLNLAAPIYVRNLEARKNVAKFVKMVKNFSDISITLTIDSFAQNYMEQISSIGLKNLEYCSVRIGVAGLLTWENGFSLEKNRRIGVMMMDMSQKLLENYRVKGVYFTEMTRCMFDEKQWEQINTAKKDGKINFLGMGCKGKRAGMEVKSNFEAIRCYGLSNLGQVSIYPGVLKGNSDYKYSLKYVANELDLRRIKYTEEILPLECRICKYHGYDADMCPGPCLIKKPI